MMTSQPDKAAGEASKNLPSDAGAQPFSIGAALREARIRLGMSVAEVSNRIKFAPRQIEALEADDFAHLPETAFVRGFVRSYAKLLQLDSVPLLAALPQAPVQSMPVEEITLAEVPFPGIYSTRKVNIVWLAAALAVALVLALFVWLFGRASDVSQTTVEAVVLPATSSVSMEEPAATMADVPQAASSVAEPAPTSSAPQQAAAIRLTFDRDSWVEITDKNGKILLSQINHAGTEQGINGTPPFSLVIGQSKAVHLYYKGQVVDLAPHTQIAVARLTLE